MPFPLHCYHPLTSWSWWSLTDLLTNGLLFVLWVQVLPVESEGTSFRESDQEKPLKTCMTQTGGGGGDVSRYKQHVQSCDEHSRVKHFTAKALSGGKNLIHQIQSGKGLLWWSSG